MGRLTSCDMYFDDTDKRLYYNKLKEYEDAEEHGLLVKLPCGIGADIYYIPSKVNFDLNVLHHQEENNKVYHQNVVSITYTRNGWYLECDKNIEYGTDGIFLDKMFGETWFLMVSYRERCGKCSC